MKQELTASPLIIGGEGYKVSLSDEAAKIKKGLIAQSLKIKTVENTAQALAARGTRDEINQVLIALEKYRKIVKAPILKAGDLVDDTAKDFRGELETEKKRLDAHLGTFAQQEEEKRQAAAREAQRLAEEAQELEAQRLAKEQEAERIRLGAEQAAAEAENAKERKEAQKAQELAAQRQREADALQRQQEAAQQQSFRSTMVVAAPVMKGSAKPHIEFDVASLTMLYEAMPDLVELVPRRAEILKVLKSQQELGQPIGIPGLKIRTEWRTR